MHFRFGYCSVSRIIGYFIEKNVLITILGPILIKLGQHVCFRFSYRSRHFMQTIVSTKGIVIICPYTGLYGSVLGPHKHFTFI